MAELYVLKSGKRETRSEWAEYRSRQGLRKLSESVYATMWTDPVMARSVHFAPFPEQALTTALLEQENLRDPTFVDLDPIANQLGVYDKIPSIPDWGNYHLADEAWHIGEYADMPSINLMEDFQNTTRPGWVQGYQTGYRNQMPLGCGPNMTYEAYLAQPMRLSFTMMGCWETLDQYGWLTG